MTPSEMRHDDPTFEAGREAGIRTVTTKLRDHLAEYRQQGMAGKAEAIERILREVER